MAFLLFVFFGLVLCSSTGPRRPSCSLCFCILIFPSSPAARHASPFPFYSTAIYICRLRRHFLRRCLSRPLLPVPLSPLPSISSCAFLSPIRELALLLLLLGPLPPFIALVVGLLWNSTLNAIVLLFPPAQTSISCPLNSRSCLYCPSSSSSGNNLVLHPLRRRHPRPSSSPVFEFFLPFFFTHLAPSCLFLSSSLLPCSTRFPIFGASHDSSAQKERVARRGGCTCPRCILYVPWPRYTRGLHAREVHAERLYTADEIKLSRAPRVLR